MLENLKSIFYKIDLSKFDVMQAIDKIGSRYALIVDENEKLKGIVTDGDIRRGFLAGKKGDDLVDTIMNSSPVVARDNLNNEEMLQLVNEKYAQIPIVDNDGKVKGVISYQDKNVLLDIKSKNICMVGLGVVGLTFSLILAELGFKVFGYDIDTPKIDDISNKKSPFHEKGIDSYIQRFVGKNFIPISNIPNKEASIYIITVGTPIDTKTKEPTISYIEEAAKTIALNLKSGDLVVLRSTVPVGTTRNIVLPILSNISGLEVGRDYYLAFAPERTIAGYAMQELTKLPQVIGGYDKKSLLIADRLFREITTTIIDAGSLEGAEMVKIMNNTFISYTFRINFIFEIPTAFNNIII